MANILAVIPARAGSKELPRKNIRSIAGKPLIAWTIEEAKKSKYIDRLILSSDDNEIINVAKNYGCEVPFIRPSHLAQDDTPGIDPVLHALDQLPGFDYVVLLQPTSPLRSVVDIDQCIEYCLKLDANACISVCEPDKSPYWAYSLANDSILKPLIPLDSSIARRQELPITYVLNGAVYVAKVSWLLCSKSFLTEETVGFIMEKERSLDIDTELDLKICEFILSM